ncbi:immunity 26/phosphotriesterase HocA family protein [Dactylosporangium sp. NBC_01737]|uniref:Imm26 family immunity protein n=1 Tax=Dactylosporangium sp. NBC_01737 TaxID=2975959 RepID=UPI002E115FD5|nr:immunity 26/phosphotriesterase HocA family protein [Dactylosporangium sp. NBC_01737]
MSDAVVVRYMLTGGTFGAADERAAVYALQERLREALAGQGAGEVSGNEFGGGEVALFLDGPDADRLYTAVEPLLRGFPHRPARATLRYGEAGDPTSVRREVDLDAGLVGPPPARPEPDPRTQVAVEGDVFRIPLDDARSVFGQVVAKEGMAGTFGDALLVVVFDALSLDAVDTADILLIANTFDDCLVAGDWPIVERRPVSADVPWPVYKESTTSIGTFVVDHFGNHFRVATPHEARTLKSRTQCSPAIVAEAARAAFGVGDWLDRYDRFIPDESATVARVIHG